MVNPVTALVVFLGLVAVGAVLVWPRVGIVARLVSSIRLTKRVLIEDTLKHLHAFEREEQPCTVHSLAGRLGVSAGRASELLNEVTARGLVAEGGGGPTLTEAGRRWALRLVRTHRLWESYLADRTGVAAEDWHAEAERVEHELTPEATDALAARLGHPRFDPHGDPIPTADGELPEPEHLSLAEAPVGSELLIIHLEDEPRETYAELLELGLGLGQRLTVEERDGSRVRVRGADGAELAVRAVSSRNVGVRPVPHHAEAGVGNPGFSASSESLADLHPGESGRVLGLAPACAGPQRRRLLDLGVVRGSVIQAELRSWGGDPVAYRISGALVALRREQANWVRVARVAASVAGNGQ